MGAILWPSKMARELKEDLKHLKRKAIRLVDEFALTEGKIQNVKERLRKLKKR